MPVGVLTSCGITPCRTSQHMQRVIMVQRVQEAGTEHQTIIDQLKAEQEVLQVGLFVLISSAHVLGYCSAWRAEQAYTLCHVRT